MNPLQSSCPRDSVHRRRWRTRTPCWRKWDLAEEEPLKSQTREPVRSMRSRAGGQRDRDREGMAQRPRRTGRRSRRLLRSCSEAVVGESVTGLKKGKEAGLGESPNDQGDTQRGMARSHLGAIPLMFHLKSSGLDTASFC